MRIYVKHDLVVLNIIGIALLAMIWLIPSSPLRIVIGLPFVLFLPGYLLVAALYPRQGDLSGVERLALSLGLSIAVVPLLGLLLNWSPWGIRLVPIMLSLLVFDLVMAAIALYRRRLLPASEVYYPAVALPVLATKGPLDLALSILLGLSILGALGALVWSISTPKVGEKFTEFYILGDEGKAANYPRQVRVGEPIQVVVGVVNHEYSVKDYRVDVRNNQHLVAWQGPIVLEHEEKWEGLIAFTPSEDGQRREIEYLLFIGDSEEPYRPLRLWVDVLPVGTPSPVITPTATSLPSPSPTLTAAQPPPSSPIPTPTLMRSGDYPRSSFAVPLPYARANGFDFRPTPTALLTVLGSQSLPPLVIRLPATGITRADGNGPTNLRRRPTTIDSPILLTIPDNTPVEITRVVEGEALFPGEPWWFEVEVEGVTGFVYYRLVEEVQLPSPTPTLTNMPSRTPSPIWTGAPSPTRLSN